MGWFNHQPDHQKRAPALTQSTESLGPGNICGQSTGRRNGRHFRRRNPCSFLKKFYLEIELLWWLFGCVGKNTVLTKIFIEVMFPLIFDILPLKFKRLIPKIITFFPGDIMCQILILGILCWVKSPPSNSDVNAGIYRNPSLYKHVSRHPPGARGATSWWYLFFYIYVNFWGSTVLPDS